MKNNIKRISVLLAAVSVMSLTATSVSAGNIWKNEGCGAVIVSSEEKTVTPVCSSGKQIFVGTKTEYKPASGVADPKNPSTIFVSEETDKYVSVKAPAIKTVYSGSCGLKGAKYYSSGDAKKALEEYFSENSCDIYMTEGQEKTFCENAYFYSTDPDVVYYDYYSDTLVAAKNGSADVYVYTTGGVPFFKLHVSVSKKWSNTKTNPTLNVVPDEWRLDVDETTGFTITASDGKTYDDIELTVVKGSSKVSLTQVSHKLTAEKNGAVVVRAHSKSNPKISGEALIYIGPYEYSVCDGYWSCGYNGVYDCINVSKWYDCWRDDCYSYINGWIKSAEGIFIPVIKVSDAVVADNGERRDTTIVTIGGVSYADLIRQAYGDKDALCSIISKYNLCKYGIFTDSDYTFCGSVDPRLFYMSQIFKYIG
ncbi:MAG: hypothetical protein ACI4XJ_03490 [Eubacteriales bacterium]